MSRDRIRAQSARVRRAWLVTLASVLLFPIGALAILHTDEPLPFALGVVAVLGSPALFVRARARLTEALAALWEARGVPAAEAKEHAQDFAANRLLREPVPLPQNDTDDTRERIHKGRAAERRLLSLR